MKVVTIADEETVIDESAYWAYGSGCYEAYTKDGDFICNFVIRGNSSIADVNRIAGQQVCYENDPSYGWGIPAYIELELAFEIDGDKYFKIPQFAL